jgi:hypothetical protein
VSAAERFVLSILVPSAVEGVEGLAVPQNEKIWLRDVLSLMPFLFIIGAA